MLLHDGHHGRRAAEQHQGVGTWRRELLLDGGGSDEARAEAPVLTGILVNHEPELEVGVTLGAILQFLAAHDVTLGLVAENERHLGLVLGVTTDVTNDLEHGGDACATSKHANVLDVVGLHRGDASGLVLALNDELALA